MSVLTIESAAGSGGSNETGTPRQAGVNRNLLDCRASIDEAPAVRQRASERDQAQCDCCQSDADAEGHAGMGGRRDDTRGDGRGRSHRIHRDPRRHLDLDGDHRRKRGGREASHIVPGCRSSLVHRPGIVSTFGGVLNQRGKRGRGAGDSRIRGAQLRPVHSRKRPSRPRPARFHEYEDMTRPRLPLRPPNGVVTTFPRPAQRIPPIASPALDRLTTECDSMPTNPTRSNIFSYRLPHGRGSDCGVTLNRETH